MIAAILPAAVVSEHTYVDLPGALHPEEEATVSGAVDKRRNEFRTTRLCARKALEVLGAPAGIIATGHRGAPRWPDGVVGSMTHCEGYRAAAVTWSRELRALGIDAEPNEVLPEGVFDLVTLPAERPRLEALPTEDRVCWDRLLFSAKESVFKAWYPVTGRELTFREAALTFDPVARTFAAELLVSDHPFGAGMAGRWACGQGLLVTSVAIPTVPPGSGVTAR